MDSARPAKNSRLTKRRKGTTHTEDRKKLKVSVENPEEIETGNGTIEGTGDNRKMTEMEVVREMGRVMMETVNRRIEVQREEREKNEDRYRQLVEEQQRSHREDTNTLTGQLERMRFQKEQASQRQTQRLPTYDGANIEFDEWQDRIEAILVCNAMDYTGLLEALPTSITGQAKRSFDSLNNQDRLTKDTFFQAMRKKLDPQAEKRNKELFIAAKRREAETIVAFIDRCRMYIRRSGGSTMEQFAIEMLKYKVLDCLPFMDRKILSATIDTNERLDGLIVKADALLGTETRLIGGVTDDQTGGEPEEVWSPERTGYLEMYGDTWEQSTWDYDDSCRRWQGLINDQSVKLPFQGYCWFCGQLGHRQKECPMQKQGEWYPENSVENQGVIPVLESCQPLMTHSFEENQVDTDVKERMSMTNGQGQMEAHREVL